MVEQSTLLVGKLMPMLYVRDVKRSVEFYRDRLGFKFGGWWSDETNSYSQELTGGAQPDFAEVRAGDMVLHLHAAGAMALPEKRGSIFHVTVDNVDAFYSEVGSRGLRVDPPQDMPWGMRHFYVTDPDGQELSFCHAI